MIICSNRVSFQTPCSCIYSVRRLYFSPVSRSSGWVCEWLGGWHCLVEMHGTMGSMVTLSDKQTLRCISSPSFQLFQSKSRQYAVVFAYNLRLKNKRWTDVGYLLRAQRPTSLSHDISARFRYGAARQSVWGSVYC